MENIQNLDPRPGDVIRDNEDGSDYVVSALGAAAGGIALFRGINILNQEIKEWKAEAYQDADITLLRKNAQDLDPDDIYNSIRDNLKKAERASKNLGDPNFLQILKSEKGKFIRDMLLIGDSVDKFDMALIDMAKSLVGTSKQTWDADQIYETLARYIPEDQFDADFIKDFSIEFEQRMQQSATKTTREAVQNLDELIIPRVDDFTRTNLRLLEKINFTSTDISDTPTHSKGFFKAMTNAGARDDVFVQKFLGGRLGEHGRANLSRLMNKIFHAMGGRHAPDLYELLGSQFLSQAVEAINSGMATPAFIEELTKMKGFDEIMTSYFKFRSTDNHAIRASTRQSFRNPLEEAIGARKGALSMNQLRRLINGDNAAGGQFSGLSIEVNTFFENYLKNGKVSFKGKDFNLDNQIDREALYTVFSKNFSNQNFLVDPEDLFKSMNRGDEILDLDHLISRHGLIEKHLQDRGIDDLGQYHMANNSLTNRSNTTIHFELRRSVSPKRYNELAEYVASGDIKAINTVLPAVPDGKQRHFITTGGDTFRMSTDLESLQDGRPLDDLSYIDLWEGEKVDGRETRHFLNSTSIFDIDAIEKAQKSNEQIKSLNDYFRLQIPLADQKTARVVGRIDGEMDDYYRMGYNSGKLTLVNINDGPLRVIGSDIQAPRGMEEIVDRIDQIYDNKSKVAYFDLEVDMTTRHIEEISLIDQNRILELQTELSDLNDEKGRLDRNVKKKLKQLTNQETYEFTELSKNLSPAKRAGHLKKIISTLNGYDVIVTKSGADYNFLIEEATLLKRSGHLTELEYDDILMQIHEIRAQKGVGSETIPMLSGHANLGETNQNFLTQKYLKKMQTHISLLDNAENYQLTQMFGDQYKEVRQKIQFTNLNTNPIMLVPGKNRVRGTSGEPIMLIGYNELANGNIQIDYMNQMGVKRSKVGTPAMMGAFMSNYEQMESVADYKDFTTRPLVKAASKLRGEMVQDMAERMIRDLNPTNRDVGAPMYKGGGDILAGTSTRLHNFRVQYIGAMLPDDLLDVPEGVEMEELEDIIRHRIGSVDDFRKKMQDAGLDHHFLVQDDELLDVIKDHVAEDLAISAADPMRRTATKQMTYELIDTGSQLLGLAMDQYSHDYFDALSLIAAKTAPQVTMKRDYFNYSMNVGVQGGLRAQSQIKSPYNVDIRSSVNAFTSELFTFPAARPDSGVSDHAQWLLKQAGIDIDNDKDFLAWKEAFEKNTGQSFEQFYEKTQAIPKLHQDFQPDNHFLNLSNKFFKNSNEAVDLMTASIRERALQLEDKTQIDTLNGLADNISNRLFETRRNWDGKGSLGAQMTHVVEEELFGFLQQDPEKHFDLLRQEYTEYNILKNLSDREWTTSVLNKLRDRAGDDPDTVLKIFQSITENDIERAEGDVDKVLDEIFARNPYEGEEVIPRSGTEAKELLPNLQMDQKDIPEVKMQAALMNRARRGSVRGLDVEETARVAREMMMNPSNFAQVKPLMALAGAAAFMGFVEPDLDEPSAGNMSDELGHINHMNRISEMPGTQKGTGIFVGQTDPFKLKLSIKGFVKNSEQQKLITEEVFNSLTNTMEFRSVRDHRVDEQDHTPMVEQMRRRLRG